MIYLEKVSRGVYLFDGSVKGTSVCGLPSEKGTAGLGGVALRDWADFWSSVNVGMQE
jgi:hypothetical protein